MKIRADSLLSSRSLVTCLSLCDEYLPPVNGSRSDAVLGCKPSKLIRLDVSSELKKS